MSKVSGPVVLLGSGEFEAWGSVLELEVLRAASGDGSVAIIPAASAPEGETYADWAQAGLDHFTERGVPSRVIELKSRSDSDDELLAAELERVTAVFFSGGNPAYLARLLAGSTFWEAVRSVVERGGAYFGCSAGACVAGEFAPDSLTGHIWQDRWMPGLRLLPNIWVIPHFDALDGSRAGTRDYFLSAAPEEGWVLGIDENTAAARFGDSWTVHGEGAAFVARHGVASRFASGLSFELEQWPPFEHPTGGASPAGMSLAAVIDAQPAGAGVIGVHSSEQFSELARALDVAMLRRSGPTVGIVLLADPSNADAVRAEAQRHYEGLGADVRLVGPEDDADGLDLVFLAGGDPSNLIPPLHGSRLWITALRRWREGMALAGSSAGAMALCEHCVFPSSGADLPTRWGRGLGPLRGVSLAVHAGSRPEEWLASIAETAPVPLVRMDDNASMLVAPGEPPMLFGSGIVDVIVRPSGPSSALASVDRRTVRLYHRTASAAQILSEGFIDSTVNPSRDGAWEGTWFADRPLPPDDDGRGEARRLVPVARFRARRRRASPQPRP